MSSVTEAIISKVRSLVGQSVADVRKELQAVEPTFYRWAKDSVKEDVGDVKYSGVTFHTEEALRNLGTIIFKARVEGFLVALMAQDKAWADSLFVDRPQESDIVPYSEPVNSLLEGRLDKAVYDRMEKEMRPEEKKNPSYWKNQALSAFRKNLEMKEITKGAKQFLHDKTKAEGKKEKPPEDDGLSEIPL